jgi:hypothetical protein
VGVEDGEGGRLKAQAWGVEKEVDLRHGRWRWRRR